jgi:2-iminobutanoate/2-iminopropanoate deaminase
MSKSSVSSLAAPAAVGPYSQAIACEGWVYLSGQIPLDPTTGKLVSGDISTQTEQVLENLSHVLEAAGASFEHVVKTTIYLTDLADFAAVNAIYAKRFATVPPARATVQVAALPLGANIEIDAVARVG